VRNIWAAEDQTPEVFIARRPRRSQSSPVRVDQGPAGYQFRTDNPASATTEDNDDDDDRVELSALADLLRVDLAKASAAAPASAASSTERVFKGNKSPWETVRQRVNNRGPQTPPPRRHRGDTNFFPPARSSAAFAIAAASGDSYVAPAANTDRAPRPPQSHVNEGPSAAASSGSVPPAASYSSDKPSAAAFGEHVPVFRFYNGPMADRFVADILGDDEDQSLPTTPPVAALTTPPAPPAIPALGAAQGPGALGESPDVPARHRALNQDATSPVVGPSAVPGSLAPAVASDDMLVSASTATTGNWVSSNWVSSATASVRQSHRQSVADPSTSNGDSGDGNEPKMIETLSAPMMLRFALLFINFTFIVASLLLAMAGISPLSSPTVTVCKRCGDLAIVTVAFGVLTWMSALFAFYWIKQRNVTFLLLHGGVVLTVSLGTVAVLISAIAMQSQLNKQDDPNWLDQWETLVRLNTTASTISESVVCNIQSTNNCSGFALGCCNPDHCYNVSDPPEWVRLVCPVGCAATPSTNMCGEQVFTAVKARMGGFIITVVFALVLAVTGMMMTAFVRSINNAQAAASSVNDIAQSEHGVAYRLLTR
jgi:hypothetical protein